VEAVKTRVSKVLKNKCEINKQKLIKRQNKLTKTKIKGDNRLK
jgi:hypothetical protein